jgi:hypothetical protein
MRSFEPKVEPYVGEDLAGAPIIEQLDSYRFRLDGRESVRLLRAGPDRATSGADQSGVPPAR